MNISDSDAQQFIDRMVAEFGDRILNPTHYPAQYAHYVKLMFHIMQLEKRTHKEG